MSEVDKRGAGELAKLDARAQEINAAHRAFVGTLKKTAEHGIRAGELLAEAKAECSHGTWLSWLEQNFEGSERSAQVYMQMFRNRAAIRAKTAETADLSISGALKELSEPSAPLDLQKDDAIRYQEFTVVSSAREQDSEIEKRKLRPLLVQYVSPENGEVPADAADAHYGKPEDQEKDLLAGWTNEERDLLERLQAGETIVINMHQDAHPNLKAWAEKAGVFVRIDRRSDWGNPFEEGKDGDQETVIYNFEHHYFPYKFSLHTRRSELQGGKALGCWCAPADCHGRILKEWAEKA